MPNEKLNNGNDKPDKQQKFVITLDDKTEDIPSNIIKMPDNSMDEILSGIIDVAKRLNIFVKENFNSKNDFIEKIGISPEDALEYFGYKKPLSYNLLLKLSRYGCDLNWLINGKSTATASADQEDSENLESMALKKEIENLVLKNDQLKTIIKGLEAQLAEIKQEISDPKNGTMAPEQLRKEIFDLLEKRLKKVMVENFGNYQKNIVTELLKKDDIFSQIEQIIAKKSDAG